MTELDAPPPPPRAGRPASLVLRGTRAAWMGTLFASAMLVAGIVASSRGKHDTLYVSAPLGVLAAAAAVVGFVLRRRDLMIWRNGVACRAAVLRSWTETSRNAGNSDWVSYQYEVAGRTLVGEHQTFGRVKRKEIWVLYDPQRPTRSIPQA